MEAEDDRAGKLRELFGYHVGAPMEGGMLGSRLQRHLGPKSEAIWPVQQVFVNSGLSNLLDICQAFEDRRWLLKQMLIERDHVQKSLNSGSNFFFKSSV